MHMQLDLQSEHLNDSRCLVIPVVPGSRSTSPCLVFLTFPCLRWLIIDCCTEPHRNESVTRHVQGSAHKQTQTHSQSQASINTHDHSCTHVFAHFGTTILPHNLRLLVATRISPAPIQAVQAEVCNSSIRSLMFVLQSDDVFIALNSHPSRSGAAAAESRQRQPYACIAAPAIRRCGRLDGACGWLPQNGVACV